MRISIGSGIKIEASPDLVEKIRRVMGTLRDVDKIEFEYDRYLVRAWRVNHGNGKKTLNFQVEEMS